MTVIVWDLCRYECCSEVCWRIYSSTRVKNENYHDAWADVRPIERFDPVLVAVRFDG